MGTALERTIKRFEFIRLERKKEGSGTRSALQTQENLSLISLSLSFLLDPSLGFLRPLFLLFSPRYAPASRQALRAPRFIYNYIYAHAMPAQPLSSAANYCVYANCDGVLRR